MLGKNGPRAVGDRYSGRTDTLGWFAEWRTRLPSNRYSRRVALLKLGLPAIGVSLLLLVVAWPRVAPLFDRLRLAAIDLREARELRMINPRYAGTDRDGRPFVITAAVGRQVPQRDDLMSLDQPVAHVQSHAGAKIVITSDSGVYQTQTQYLDLFGHVTINHEDGTTFVTSVARIDAAHNTADGTAPVEGHGPRGDIAAQGFRILDGGDITIFTGQSNLLLKSAAQQVPTVTPAAVPPPIAQAAAQIEAKAEAAPATSAAHPAPAKKAKPAPGHAAKPPAHAKPAPKKSG